MILDIYISIESYLSILNESVLNLVGPIFNRHVPALNYSLYLPVTYLVAFMMFSVIYLTIGNSKNKRWRIESSKSAMYKIKNFELPAQVFAYVRRMDPFTFEELLLTSIDRNSFVKIKRNSKYTGDGGVDGRFYINGKLFLLQAKRYKGYVKTSDVQSLLEKTEEHNAAGAIFVHTGKTTNAALKKYTEGKVFIVSGRAMCTLVQKGKLPIGLLSLAQSQEA